MRNWLSGWYCYGSREGPFNSSIMSELIHPFILPSCNTAILPSYHTSTSILLDFYPRSSVLRFCHPAILLCCLPNIIPHCHTSILLYCNPSILLFTITYAHLIISSRIIMVTAHHWVEKERPKNKTFVVE